MKIILSPIGDILRNIGVQTYSSTNAYRMILYTILKKVEDGVLIYNTLTREIVLIEYDEYEKLIVKKEDCRCFEYLVQHWFFIPSNLSEKTIVYLLRQKLLMRHPSITGHSYNLFTIFTTTVCNARCFYCYESGVTQKSMSDITAIDTVEYIKNNAAKTIRIKWFGGEPLCNTDAMNIISKKLSDENIDFSSVITTNGILADRFSRETWIDLWRVKRIQITLDGTRDVYNATKSYIEKINDPFKKVMNNIKYLADMGITIHIRMTLTTTNYADLINLIHILKNEFSEYKNVLVYTAMLYEGCGTPQIMYSDEERRELYKQYIAIHKLLRRLCLGGKYGPPKLNVSHCMADNGRSIVILPDGNLSLCEHQCDEGFCGSIYNSKIDKSIISEYRESRPESDKCNSCFYYPQCITLKKCPTDPTCCYEYINLKKYSIKTMMSDMYKKYLQNERNGKSNIDSKKRNRIH